MDAGISNAAAGAAPSGVEVGEASVEADECKWAANQELVIRALSCTETHFNLHEVARVGKGHRRKKPEASVSLTLN